MLSRGFLLSAVCFIISNILLYWVAGGILIHKEDTPLSVDESNEQDEPILQAKVGERTLKLYEQHQLQGGRYYHYDDKNKTDFELEFSAITPFQQQELMLDWPVCRYYHSDNTEPDNTNMSSKSADKNQKPATPQYIIVTASHGRLRLSEDSQKLETLKLNSEDIYDNDIHYGIQIASLGLSNITMPPVKIRGFRDSQANSQELLQLDTANLNMNFSGRDIQKISNDCFVNLVHYNLEGKKLLHFQGVGLESDWTLEQLTIQRNVQIDMASELWQMQTNIDDSKLPVKDWHSECYGKVYVQYQRDKSLIYIMQDGGVIVTGNQGKLQCQQLEMWLAENPDSKQRWQPRKLLAQGKVEWSDGEESARNHAKAEICEVIYNSDGSMKTTLQNNPEIIIADITNFTLMPDSSRQKLVKEQEKYNWKILRGQCRDKIIWTRPSKQSNRVEYFELLGNVKLRQLSEKIQRLELDCQRAEFCLAETKESQHQHTTRVPLWLRAYKNVYIKHDRGQGKGQFLQWYNLTPEELSALLITPHQGLTQLRTRALKRQSSLQAYNPLLQQACQDDKLAVLLYSIAWSSDCEKASWIGLAGNPIIWVNGVATGNSVWQGDFLADKTKQNANQTTKQNAKDENKKLENLTMTSNLPLMNISYRTKHGRKDIYYGKQNVTIVRSNLSWQAIGKMNCQALLAMIEQNKLTKKSQLRYLEALQQVQFGGPEGYGGGDRLTMAMQNGQEIFQLIGNAWTKNEQGTLRGNRFVYNLTTQKFQAMGKPVLLSGEEFGALGDVLTYDTKSSKLELTGQLAEVWQPIPQPAPLSSTTNTARPALQPPISRPSTQPSSTTRPASSSTARPALQPPISRPSAQQSNTARPALQPPATSQKKHLIRAQKIIYWRELGRAEAYGQIQLEMTADQKQTNNLSLWKDVEAKQNKENKQSLPHSDTNKMSTNFSTATETSPKRYRLISDNLTAEFDTEQKAVRFIHAQGNIDLQKIFPENTPQERMQGYRLEYTPQTAKLQGSPARIIYGDNTITSSQFDFQQATKKVTCLGPIQATLVTLQDTKNTASDKVPSQYLIADSATPKTNLARNTTSSSTASQMFTKNNEPIQVSTQGSMELFQEKNYLELKQNVQVATSQAQLNCNRLRVFFEKQKIQNIIADDQVVLQSQGNFARAHQLRWSDQANTALLIGAPKVFLQTKDFTLQTNMAWYDIKTRRFLTRGPNILLEAQPQNPSGKK